MGRSCEVARPFHEPFLISAATIVQHHRKRWTVARKQSIDTLPFTQHRGITRSEDLAPVSDEEMDCDLGF